MHKIKMKESEEMNVFAAPHSAAIGRHFGTAGQVFAEKNVKSLVKVNSYML